MRSFACRSKPLSTTCTGAAAPQKVRNDSLNIIGPMRSRKTYGIAPYVLRGGEGRRWLMAHCQPETTHREPLGLLKVGSWWRRRCELNSCRGAAPAAVPPWGAWCGSGMVFEFKFTLLRGRLAGASTVTRGPGIMAPMLRPRARRRPARRSRWAPGPTHHDASPPVFLVSDL